MSEKLLILPKEEAGFIYPSDIDCTFCGTITVLENNELIGFIYYNDEDWVFVKGIDQIGWFETLEEILKKYSQYQFKINSF